MIVKNKKMKCFNNPDGKEEIIPLDYCINNCPSLDENHNCTKTRESAKAFWDNYNKQLEKIK
jgi:hypothetical protein